MFEYLDAVFAESKCTEHYSNKKYRQSLTEPTLCTIVILDSQKIQYFKGQPFMILSDTYVDLIKTDTNFKHVSV